LDLGDPITFAGVYDAHHDTACAVAREVLRDREAAEDIAQEVFSALWRRPSLYDPSRGSVGHFVRVMARSRALDALRTRQAKERAVDRLARLVRPEAADDALRSAERAELRGCVRRSLASLPHPQREAVALTFWGGLDGNELAACVDTPLGTAKSRVRLALAKLGRDPDLSHLAPPPPVAALPLARRRHDRGGVDLLCLAALGLRRPARSAA
jgi:RNA polymerase sigma-70 factor, ECF subfamily